MEYAMLDAQQIGNRMKKLREDRGMTIVSESSLIGVSQSAITMYETGQRIPRDEIKIRIAELFKVPVESIFFPTKQHET